MDEQIEKVQTPQDILLAAQQAILRGDMEHAQEIVATLTSKKGLSIQQKLKLSHELQWLGMPIQAMKVLGKIATQADFHLLAPEDFCLQVRAIYMLNFLGATYVARRSLKRIEEHLKQNKIDLSGYHFSLETYKAFILYESARYQDALVAFKKILATTKDPTTKIYLSLHYIVCLEATGETSAAIELALANTKEIPNANETLKAMYFQNLGRIEILSDNVEQGIEYIEQALKYFGKEHRNKDQAYAHLWQAVAKGKSGDKPEAKRLLDIAWDVLHHPLSQPQSQLTVLYWMEKLGFNLDLASRLAIRAHSCIHSFSYLLGKPILESPYPLHARVLKEAKANNEHDCWLITKDEIQPVAYNNIELKQYDRILDLYSGVEKNGDERETFTEIQVRALIATLGSGPIGIHEYALVDFIYRQEFWDWQSGKERLKKLVQYLRKKGMPLTVSNQIHKLELEDLKTFPIIVPMALDLQGHHHFVKSHASTFSRYELEEILGTKKTNASLILKDWISKGYVEESGKDGPKVFYSFVN